jgi:hypothetical protein
MADHPSGNPDLVRQHKEKQREGDEELGQKSGLSKDEVKNREARPIGTGKPDAEEGVGTVQNQAR